MKRRPGSEWESAALAALPRARAWLVGVSGGRDSVALLHWLHERGFHKLIVCHLDHGLRGRAARADAAFVRRLAAKLELPCEVERVAVRALAEETKQSPEAAGRAARLGFFTRVARRRRCPRVFLGHHADDQVETFLLRLFRGAGGRGLSAMREVSQIGALQIVRPFLGVWRSEIDAYVAEQRLKFREDATNMALDARRNRVRHKLIPGLEKQFGRNLRTSLWRAASIHAEENAFLESLLPNESFSGEALSIAELRALPLALQRRALVGWLRTHEVAEVGFDLVERIRALILTGATVARTNLPRGRFVRRRAGKLFFD